MHGSRAMSNLSNGKSLEEWNGATIREECSIYWAMEAWSNIGSNNRTMTLERNHMSSVRNVSSRAMPREDVDLVWTMQVMVQWPIWVKECPIWVMETWSNDKWGM